MGSLDLTLSRGRSLWYRNQSIGLQSKSTDWFLYDRDLRHEDVNGWVQSLDTYENSDRVFLILIFLFKSSSKKTCPNFCFKNDADMKLVPDTKHNHINLKIPGKTNSEIMTRFLTTYLLFRFLPDWEPGFGIKFCVLTEFLIIY